MSNTLKAVVAFGLITVVAAGCAQQEEEVVVVEQPMVVAEPVSGKY